MTTPKTLRSVVGVAAAAALYAAPAIAQCPAVDSYEDNDDCLSAVALANGSYPGLTLEGPSAAGGEDLDFYSVALPAGEALTVDCLHVASGGNDIDVYFYDANDPGITCGNHSNADYLVRGFTGSDDEHVHYTNVSGAAMTIIVEIEPYSSSMVCTDYDLVISTAVDLCLTGTDDSFEDNDDCASAVPLAAGTHPGLIASLVDEDFYSLTVAPNDQVIIDMTYSTDNQMRMRLYDDAACTNEIASASYGGADQVIASNATGAPTTFYLQVLMYSSTYACNDYDLVVTQQADPCLLGLDDALEDNDDCASAVALAAGVHTGLFASQFDEDFYALAVPTDHQVFIDLSYSTDNQMKMYLYDDAACNNQIDYGGYGGSDQVTAINTTGAPITLYLRVLMYSSSDDCNDYDLAFAHQPDLCLVTPDDALEDNDLCFAPATVNNGAYANLFVHEFDMDYYAMEIQDGDMINIDVLFADLTGDIDIRLYLASDCYGVELASGGTTSDNESVTYTNNSGATESLVLEVYMFNSSSNTDCQTYDMSITGASVLLATPMCFGDGTMDAGNGGVNCPCSNNSTLGAGEGCMNSQGHGAILTASGTTIAANDDLVFSVSQARPGQPSMLVQGNTMIALTFRDGLLCTSTATELIEVVFLDGNGEGSTIGSIVTGGAVTAGDSRFYQQWYRDPNLSVCGNGSSFTQGLRVSWL